MNRMMSWFRRGSMRLNRMPMGRMMGRRGTMMSLTTLAVGATAIGLMRRRNMNHTGNLLQRAMQPIRSRMGR